jgi:predicted amidohydrolase
MKSVRAAVAQVRAAADTARAIEAVGDFCGRAGAQLVVFPEALLGGYPRGSNFGTVVGSRTAARRAEFLAYHRAAVTIPGPEVDALAEIAQRHDLHICQSDRPRRGAGHGAAIRRWGRDRRPIAERARSRRRAAAAVPDGAQRLFASRRNGQALAASNSVPRSCGRRLRRRPAHT